jgi:hypothetical protein
MAAFYSATANLFGFNRFLMFLNESLGKTLLIPTPGQARLFTPSNIFTSSSCSIATAKSGLRHRTLLLQRLAHLLLNSTTMLAFFPFLPLTLSLLYVFGRMRKTATLMLALSCPRNVGSPNRSCKRGAATKLLSAIRLPNACVMYTSCRESVLFIGTQFSNLYTAVDTPARGRVVAISHSICAHA